jgi:tRNA-intron endonuclease
LKGELLENRIVVWNTQESRDLFANGYFGKPIGIPKPNVNDINVPLILDLIEGCYLQEISKILLQ